MISATPLRRCDRVWAPWASAPTRPRRPMPANPPARRPRAAAPVTTAIREATPADHDALFAAFAVIVASREGFPQAPPLSRPDFDDYWIGHSSAVFLAM